MVLGCNLDEAQDLAQTALLRCFTGWRRVRAADDRDAYVYQILLNCHRDSRRRRWWGERPTDGPPEPEPTADPGTRVASFDALQRALADLPLIHRQVVVLRHLAQLTEQQTADLLDIAPGTAKSRLSRALAQLATNDHLQDLREGPHPSQTTPAHSTSSSTASLSTRCRWPASGTTPPPIAGDAPSWSPAWRPPRRSRSPAVWPRSSAPQTTETVLDGD